jgi:TPR repeat protein
VEALVAPLAHAWARAYLFGFGVKQDLKIGTQYLQKAVGYDALNVDAQFLLGRAYQNGWGLEPDPALAYQHMRIAADLGDERAQWQAAMMLLRGAGVATDAVQAYSLVKQSAEQGFVQGMISHAVMLATGEGVAEDDAEALSWYRKAADTGSAHALRGIGAMYVQGEGVPRDVALGFALLELAETAGEPVAVQILQSLRQTENPDRAAVDKAKAAWLAAHVAPSPAR